MGKVDGLPKTHFPRGDFWVLEKVEIEVFPWPEPINKMNINLLEWKLDKAGKCFHHKKSEECLKNVLKTEVDLLVTKVDLSLSTEDTQGAKICIKCPWKVKGNGTQKTLLSIRSMIIDTDFNHLFFIPSFLKFYFTLIIITKCFFFKW